MTTFPTEDLTRPDIKIAGFQLWILGYQYPDVNDPDDANWTRVVAHSGAVGASVWVSGSLVQISDLERWGDECDRMLRTGNSTAVLGSYEPDLFVEISVADRLGHLTMKVEITPDHLTQSHSFQFEIDQSYLPSLIAQCREATKRFPLRGIRA